MKKLILLLTLVLLASCSKVDLKTEVAAAAQLLKAEEWKSAELQLERLMAAADNSPQIYVMAALAKAGSDKKQEVTSLIEKALKVIEEKPEEAESFAQLGRACLMVGYNERALELLQKSNALRPDDLYVIQLLVAAERNIFLSRKKSQAYRGLSQRNYLQRNQYLNYAGKFDELNKSLQFYNLTAVSECLSASFDSKQFEHRYSIEQKLTKAHLINKKEHAIILNLAVCYDIYFKKKSRAVGFYKMYLDLVKLLPPDQTQATKVERRLSQLEPQLLP